jgi:hypothetical protein
MVSGNVVNKDFRLKQLYGPFYLQLFYTISRFYLFRPRPHLSSRTLQNLTSLTCSRPPNPTNRPEVTSLTF